MSAFAGQLVTSALCVVRRLCAQSEAGVDASLSAAVCNAADVAASVTLDVCVSGVALLRVTLVNPQMLKSSRTCATGLVMVPVSCLDACLCCCVCVLWLFCVI